MIIALMGVALLVYNIVVMRRAQHTRSDWAGQDTPRGFGASALEDDPALWPTTGQSWTALDERQLIRLLTDSAP